MSTPSQRRSNAEAADAALKANSNLNSVSGANKNTYGSGGNVYNPNSNFSSLYNQIANANAANNTTSATSDQFVNDITKYNLVPAGNTASTNIVQHYDPNSRRATSLETSLKTLYDAGEDLANTKIFGKSSGEAWEGLKNQFTGKEDFNPLEVGHDLASFGATLLPSWIGGLAQDPAKIAMAGGGADIANMNTAKNTINNEALTASQRAGYAVDAGTDVLGFVPGVGLEARAASTALKAAKLGKAAVEGTEAAGKAAAKAVSKKEGLSLTEKLGLKANTLSENNKKFKNLGYNTVTGLASVVDEGLQEAVQGGAQQFEENKNQKWEDLDWGAIGEGAAAGMLGGGMFHAASTAIDTGMTSLVNSADNLQKHIAKQRLNEAAANNTEASSIYGGKSNQALSDADKAVLDSDSTNRMSRSMADKLASQEENQRKKNYGSTWTATNDDSIGGFNAEVDDTLVARAINKSREESGDYVTALNNTEDTYTPEMKKMLYTFMPHETEQAIADYKAAHPDATDVTYASVMPTDKQRKWAAEIQEAYDNNGEIELKSDKGNVIGKKTLEELANEVFDGGSRALPRFIHRSPFTNEGPLKGYITRFRKGNYTTLGRLNQELMGGDNDGDLVSFLKDLQGIRITRETGSSINVRLAHANPKTESSITNGKLSSYWERGRRSAQLGLLKYNGKKKGFQKSETGKAAQKAAQGIHNTKNYTRASLEVTDFSEALKAALKSRTPAGDVKANYDFNTVFDKTTKRMHHFLNTVANPEGNVEQAAIKLHGTLYKELQQVYDGTKANYDEFYDFIVETMRDSLHQTLRRCNIAYSAYNDVSAKGSTSAELQEDIRRGNIEEAMKKAAERSQDVYSSNDRMATPYDMGGALNDVAKGQLAGELHGDSSNLDVATSVYYKVAGLLRNAFSHITPTKHETGIGWDMDTALDMSRSQLMSVLFSISRNLNAHDYSTAKTVSTIFRTSLLQEFSARWGLELSKPEYADLRAAYGDRINDAIFDAREMYADTKVAHQLRELVYKIYGEAYEQVRSDIETEIKSYTQEQSLNSESYTYMKAILPASIKDADGKTNGVQAYFYMMKDTSTETYFKSLSESVDGKQAEIITRFCTQYPTLGDMTAANAALYTGEDVMNSDTPFASITRMIAENADGAERSAFLNDLRTVSAAYGQGKESGLRDVAEQTVRYVAEYVQARNTNPEYAAYLAGLIYDDLSAFNPAHYYNNQIHSVKDFIANDPVFRELIKMVESKEHADIKSGDIDHAMNLMYATQMDALFDATVTRAVTTTDDDGVTSTQIQPVGLREWCIEILETAKTAEPGTPEAAALYAEARNWLDSYLVEMLPLNSNNPYVTYMHTITAQMFQGVEGGPDFQSLLNSITDEQVLTAMQIYHTEWAHMTAVDYGEHSLASKKRYLAGCTGCDETATPWFAYAYVGLTGDIDMSDMKTTILTAKTQYVSAEYLDNRVSCRLEAESLFKDEGFKSDLAQDPEAAKRYLRTALDMNNTIALPEDGLISNLILDTITNIPKQQMDKGAASPVAHRVAQAANMGSYNESFKTLLEQYQEPLVGDINWTTEKMQNPAYAGRLMLFLLSTDSDAHIAIDGISYTPAELWQDILGEKYRANDFANNFEVLISACPEFACAAFQPGRLVTTTGADGNPTLRYSNRNSNLSDIYKQAKDPQYSSGSVTAYHKDKLDKLVELGSATMSLSFPADGKNRMQPGYLDNMPIAKKNMNNQCRRAAKIVGAKSARIYVDYLNKKAANPAYTLEEHMEKYDLLEWVQRNVAHPAYDTVWQRYDVYRAKGQTLYDTLNGFQNKIYSYVKANAYIETMLDNAEVQKAAQDITTDSLDAFTQKVTDTLNRLKDDGIFSVDDDMSILDVLLSDTLQHTADVNNPQRLTMEEYIAQELLSSALMVDVRTKLNLTEDQFNKKIHEAVSAKLTSLFGANGMQLINSALKSRGSAISTYITQAQKYIQTHKGNVYNENDLRFKLEELLRDLYAQDKSNLVDLPVGYDSYAMTNLLRAAQDKNTSETEMEGYLQALAVSAGIQRLSASTGGKNFDFDVINNINGYTKNLASELEAMVRSYDIMYEGYTEVADQDKFRSACVEMQNAYKDDVALDSDLQSLANGMDFTTTAENSNTAKGAQAKQNEDQTLRSGMEGNAPYITGLFLNGYANVMECGVTMHYTLTDLADKRNCELVLTDDIINKITTTFLIDANVRAQIGSLQSGDTLYLTSKRYTALTRAYPNDTSTQFEVYSPENADKCLYGCCKHHHKRVGLDVRRLLSDSQENAGFKLMKTFRPTLSTITGELNKVINTWSEAANTASKAGYDAQAAYTFAKNLLEKLSAGDKYAVVGITQTDIYTECEMIFKYLDSSMREAVYHLLMVNAQQNKLTALDSFSEPVGRLLAAAMTAVHEWKLPALTLDANGNVVQLRTADGQLVYDTVYMTNTEMQRFMNEKKDPRDAYEHGQGENWYTKHCTAQPELYQGARLGLPQVTPLDTILNHFWDTVGSLIYDADMNSSEVLTSALTEWSTWRGKVHHPVSAKLMDNSVHRSQRLDMVLGNVPYYKKGTAVQPYMSGLTPHPFSERFNDAMGYPQRFNNSPRRLLNNIRMRPQRALPKTEEWTSILHNYNTYVKDVRLQYQNYNLNALAQGAAVLGTQRYVTNILGPTAIQNKLDQAALHRDQHEHGLYTNQLTYVAMPSADQPNFSQWNKEDIKQRLREAAASKHYIVIPDTGSDHVRAFLDWITPNSTAQSVIDIYDAGYKYRVYKPEDILGLYSSTLDMLPHGGLERLWDYDTDTMQQVAHDRYACFAYYGKGEERGDSDGTHNLTNSGVSRIGRKATTTTATLKSDIAYSGMQWVQGTSIAGTDLLNIVRQARKTYAEHAADAEATQSYTVANTPIIFDKRYLAQDHSIAGVLDEMEQYLLKLTGAGVSESELRAVNIQQNKLIGIAYTLQEDGTIQLIPVQYHGPKTQRDGASEVVARILADKSSIELVQPRRGGAYSLLDNVLKFFGIKGAQKGTVRPMGYDVFVPLGYTARNNDSRASVEVYNDHSQASSKLVNDPDQQRFTTFWMHSSEFGLGLESARDLHKLISSSELFNKAWYNDNPDLVQELAHALGLDVTDVKRRAQIEYDGSRNHVSQYRGAWSKLADALQEGKTVFNREIYGDKQQYIGVLIQHALTADVNPAILLNPTGHNDIFKSALSDKHYIKSILPSYTKYLYKSTVRQEKIKGEAYTVAYCPESAVNLGSYEFDKTTGYYIDEVTRTAYSTLNNNMYGTKVEMDQAHPERGEYQEALILYSLIAMDHDTNIGETAFGTGYAGPSLQTKLYNEGRLRMDSEDDVRQILKEGYARYKGYRVKDPRDTYVRKAPSYDARYARQTRVLTQAQIQDMLHVYGSKWIKTQMQDAQARLHAYETPIRFTEPAEGDNTKRRSLQEFADEANLELRDQLKSTGYTAQEWSVFVAHVAMHEHLTKDNIEAGSAHWHLTVDYDEFRAAHKLAIAMVQNDMVKLNNYSSNKDLNGYAHLFDIKALEAGTEPLGFYAVTGKTGNIRGANYKPVILYLPNTIRDKFLGKLKNDNAMKTYMSHPKAMEHELAKYRLCIKQLSENTKTASLGDLSHMKYVYRFMSNEIHNFDNYWNYMTIFDLMKVQDTESLYWDTALNQMQWTTEELEEMRAYTDNDRSMQTAIREYSQGSYTINSEVAGAETDIQQIHRQYVHENAGKVLQHIMRINKATAMANPAVRAGNVLDTIKGRIGQRLALDLGEKLNCGVYKSTKEPLSKDGVEYKALSDDFIDVLANEPKVYLLMQIRKLILNSSFDSNETMANMNAWIASELEAGRVPDLKEYCKFLENTGTNPKAVLGAKAYNKIMEFGSGAGYFKKTAVRNYLRLLRRNLEETRHPIVTHARKDANGNMISELQYAMTQEDPAIAFFKLMYSPAYGVNYAANLAEQQNLRAEMANDNAVAIFMDALFSRSDGSQFFLNTMLGCTFPRAFTNINGRLLSSFLPASSMNYTLCSKIVMSFDENGVYQGGILDNFLIGMNESEKQRFLMLALHRAQAAAGALNWQEALRLDMMHFSLPALAMMIAAMGLLQPPDDDRLKDDYEEWLFCFPGQEPQRIALNWFLKEAIGPVLPLAVFWTSCYRGEFNFNIITNGLWDMACSNIFTNTGDLINVILDPETAFETYDTDTEYYDKDNLTDTSLSEYVAGKAANLGLTYLGRVFTPGVLLELSRDSYKYEKSYNRVYKTDANGQLIEDSSYTEKTDYIDSQIRKYTRNNIFAGLIFDVLHGFSGTGYTSWEMPNQIKYDSLQTQFQAEHSIMEYDENGYKTDTAKSTDEQQKVCAKLLYQLVNTDADTLYNEGWYLDNETKLALSNYIWDIYQDEIDRWSYLNQNGYLDRYTLSATGSYTEGANVYSGLYNEHMTILNTIKEEWYSKLWSDELNQGRVLYNQYNTTYKQASDGTYYSTGIKQSLTDAFLPWRNIAESDSVDDASRSVFGGYQYTTEGMPARALDAYVSTDSMETPEWDTLSGYRQHTSTTEQTTAANTSNTNRSNNYGKKSSGGYSRSGGGSSYARSVSNAGSSYRNNISHSNLSPATQQATGIMGARRIYDTTLDYLRPAVETKGSRQAYKREDI